MMRPRGQPALCVWTVSSLSSRSASKRSRDSGCPSIRNRQAFTMSRMVDPDFDSWNQIAAWLKGIYAMTRADMRTHAKLPAS